MNPGQRHQLRLPLLVAGLLLGAALALLVTNHPTASVVTLVFALAIVIAVLADMIILGGR